MTANMTVMGSAQRKLTADELEKVEYLPDCETLVVELEPFSVTNDDLVFVKELAKRGYLRWAHQTRFVEEYLPNGERNNWWENVEPGTVPWGAEADGREL